MKNLISFEDVILETLPFAEELKKWCKSHAEFYKALKVIYSERFLHLGSIVTSTSPNYPDDEVIGIYAYDYQINIPIFKQDFIVNKGRLYKEFLLFTRNPGGSSKWVKDINEFGKTYGKGGYYMNTHHLSYKELPEKIKPRGIEAKRLADKIKKYGFKKPSQDRIDAIYRQLIAEKKNIWFTIQKLNELK